MEEFLTIPSFPDYLISNFGRCKTKKRQIRYVHAVTKEEHWRLKEEQFLKVQYNGKTGYKFHQLYLNKRMFNRAVHILVAEAFLEKIPGKEYVNHKDGNKHNNIVDNLERCTNEYNHEHATKTGLKAKGSEIGSSVLNDRCVLAIKHLLKLNWTHQKIADIFSISRACVSHIKEGKTWKHIKI